MDRNPFTCYRCKVPYQLVRTDFSARGVIVKNVEGYRCPSCAEEIFTSEQAGQIETRLESLIPRAPLIRKISSASGRKPAVYLPQGLLDSVQLKIGDPIALDRRGKRGILISPA